MAFSIGSTPAVVSSDPAVAREILSHPSFAVRPVKRSARQLMFARAISFTPSGAYRRLLRRISSTHLFSLRRVAAHEPGRQADCMVMLAAVAEEQDRAGSVRLHLHLQDAALNNIMGSVFGRRYDVSRAGGDPEDQKLKQTVREGFDILGAFNWCDHLPWLAHLYDPYRIKQRCAALVPRVRELVSGIIEEHKKAGASKQDNADFVDVLLSLEGDEKLSHDDMIAVLWEMIFRGTDTTVLLTEWAMAELVLHPDVQAKLSREIDAVVGAHRTGPAALLCPPVHRRRPTRQRVVVPVGTTAMVNLWDITQDAKVWARPEDSVPKRFMVAEGGVHVDVRGGDLRLDPFGAGRRVCPGKNLGFVTVGLWIARLVHHFEWAPADGAPVDHSEVHEVRDDQSAHCRRDSKE